MLAIQSEFSSLPADEKCGLIKGWTQKLNNLSTVSRDILNQYASYQDLINKQPVATFQSRAYTQAAADFSATLEKIRSRFALSQSQNGPQPAQQSSSSASSASKPRLQDSDIERRYINGSEGAKTGHILLWINKLRKSTTISQDILDQHEKYEQIIDKNLPSVPTQLFLKNVREFKTLLRNARSSFALSQSQNGPQPAQQSSSSASSASKPRLKDSDIESEYRDGSPANKGYRIHQWVMQLKKLSNISQEIIDKYRNYEKLINKYIPGLSCQTYEKEVKEFKAELAKAISRFALSQSQNSPQPSSPSSSPRSSASTTLSPDSAPPSPSSNGSPPSPSTLASNPPSPTNLLTRAASSSFSPPLAQNQINRILFDFAPRAPDLTISSSNFESHQFHTSWLKEAIGNGLNQYDKQERAALLNQLKTEPRKVVHQISTWLIVQVLRECHSHRNTFNRSHRAIPDFLAPYLFVSPNQDGKSLKQLMGEFAKSDEALSPQEKAGALLSAQLMKPDLYPGSSSQIAQEIIAIAGKIAEESSFVPSEPLLNLLQF